MKLTEYVGYVRICAYRLRWDGGTKLESLLGEGLGRLGNRDVNESVELHCVLVWQLGRGLSTVFAEGGHPEVSVEGRWRAGLWWTVRTVWTGVGEQRRGERAANE